MSAEVILAYITGLGHMRRLEFQVATQCAPVLKGIKASNMVTVAKGSFRYLQPSLRAAGVTCIRLFAGEKTEVLLLYRHHLLNALLTDRDVQGFLGKCGYDRFEAVPVILELRRRYVSYSMKESPFPHELGVVLEYPVKDVEGFIQNGGENYLLSGYWKVYENPGQAKRRFALYDKAREMAMQQVVDGCSLGEVAVQERRVQYE